jgi:hypothetical protein
MGLHHPGDFHAEREGRFGRLLVGAFHHQEIGEIEPAGGDADQDLPLPGGGAVDLRHSDGLADFFDPCRLHPSPLSPWVFAAP